MSFEVLIQVKPPAGDVWPPPEAEFKAWAQGLAAFVQSFGSRTINAYGPNYVDDQGRDAPQALVNIWTDEYFPESWSDAFSYAQDRVEALVLAGYDVSAVEISPSEHLVLIG
jgi:hypothetical protein